MSKIKQSHSFNKNDNPRNLGKKEEVKMEREMEKYSVEFKSKYWGESPIHITEKDLYKDIKLEFTSEEIEKNENLKCIVNSNTKEIILPDKFLNSMVGDYFTIENEKVIPMKSNIDIFEKIIGILIQLLRRDYKGTICNPYNYKNPYVTSRLAFILDKEELFCLGCTLDAFKVKEKEIPIYKEVKLVYSYVDKYENTFYVEKHGDECWINPSSASNPERGLISRILSIKDETIRNKVALETLHALSGFSHKNSSMEKVIQKLNKIINL